MKGNADGTEEQTAAPAEGGNNPALRGPERSNQPPQTAAATPRKKMNRVNTQLRSATLQSQVVVTSASMIPALGAQATGLPPVSARLNGSQKTLNPYAMPMHRWIANAAGGTNHRLKPGGAMVRARDSRPPS